MEPRLIPWSAAGLIRLSDFAQPDDRACRSDAGPSREIDPLSEAVRAVAQEAVWPPDCSVPRPGGVDDLRPGGNPGMGEAGEGERGCRAQELRWRDVSRSAGRGHLREQRPGGGAAPGGRPGSRRSGAGRMGGGHSAAPRRGGGCGLRNRRDHLHGRPCGRFMQSCGRPLPVTGHAGHAFEVRFCTPGNL